MRGRFTNYLSDVQTRPRQESDPGKSRVSGERCGHLPQFRIQGGIGGPAFLES